MCYSLSYPSSLYSVFFFNDTATTEIYTLSLHDALPISVSRKVAEVCPSPCGRRFTSRHASLGRRCNRRSSADRKSTRLNSSHRTISYAVFCLKKKKKRMISTLLQRHTPTGKYIASLTFI